MWKDKMISVILPAYNEEENISAAIQDFSYPFIYEIIVVNNNSTDRTEEEVRKTKAVLINESRQGYGYAIQRGLREAQGNYIIISEPDGTFSGHDIFKLLVYAEEFDMVLGTRTSKSCIWKGANMGLFLKWGNWFVAKLLELLFNGPSLTDVGCTMRLIKKEALEKIQDKFTVGGSYFSPEMTILGILNGLKIVEVPLNYRPRSGESKITGNKFMALRVGLKMIALIFKYWIKNIFR